MAKTGILYFLEFNNKLWKPGDTLPIITYRTSMLDIITLNDAMITTINPEQNTVTLMDKNGESYTVLADNILDAYTNDNRIFMFQ